MNLILNRDFKTSDDGWYQFAPLGEFSHAASGLIQVVDVEACAAMVARFKADAMGDNFAGLLVDFDHFSLDDRARSEAAGWIVDLAGRETGPAAECATRCGAGLWGKIRWSDVGETAVKGGRYRFLSPVWARSDCVDLGNGRVRPIRLLNAAVTNDPNLKGLSPLSNSGQGSGFRVQEEQPVDSCASYRGPHGKGDRTMKSVIEKLMNHLGLAADATEAVILEKMAGLPALTAVTDLQNSLRDLQTKHDVLAANLKTVEGELVNRHLVEFEGLISDGSKAFWAGQLVANRAAALAALGDLTSLRDASGNTDPGKASARVEETRKPLHNRSTTRPVPPGQVSAAAGADGESKAVTIRNRAHEIAKAEGVPFGVAFRRAEREVIGQ